MITIFHQHADKDIAAWKERLDQLFLKHEIIEDANLLLPRLVDDKKIAEGKPAIDAYIDGLEQFVKGWYEDRCDKYEFDAGQ